MTEVLNDLRSLHHELIYKEKSEDKSCGEAKSTRTTHEDSNHISLQKQKYTSAALISMSIGPFSATSLQRSCMYIFNTVHQLKHDSCYVFFC